MKQVYPFISPFLLYRLSLTRQKCLDPQFRNAIAKNKNLVGSKKGKRCFILGTAPSISEIDLSPLKNEDIFFVNSFYKHPDFDRLFNSNPEGKSFVIPPVHPPLSETEWVNITKDFENKVNPAISYFCGLNRYEKNMLYLTGKYKLLQDFNVHYYYAGIQTNLGYSKFNPKHLDISKPVWASGTGSVYALVVAVSLGYSDIYLLGVDHSYLSSNEPGKYRFYEPLNGKDEDIESKENEKLQNRSLNTIILKGTYEAFEQYRLLKEHSGCNIINLSKGGIVDVFERKDYLTVL